MHASQCSNNCCVRVSCKCQWLHMHSPRRAGTSLKIWAVQVVFERLECPRSEWTRVRKERTMLYLSSGFAPHGVPEVYLRPSARRVLCGGVRVVRRVYRQDRGSSAPSYNTERNACGAHLLPPKSTVISIFYPRGIFYPRRQGSGLFFPIFHEVCYACSPGVNACSPV
jgi:hypothetical protein